MSRATLFRLVFASLTLAPLAGVGFASPADAGGGPPRPKDLHLVADYINCVDDEVDAPGVDGHALVRVRFHHDLLSNVVVNDGSWQLNVDGFELASGSFVTPALVEPGATWEQMVIIPGGTGPANFRAVVHVSSEGFPGETTFPLDPIEAPGDCPQPEKPTPPTTTPQPTVETTDIVRVTPRFTG